MRLKFFLAALFLLVLSGSNSVFAQVAADAKKFDAVKVADELREQGVAEQEIPGILSWKKAEFDGMKDSAWQKRTFAPNPTPMAPCNNIGFEDGTFTGWTGSTGGHPNYGGCCPTPGFVSNGMNAGAGDPNARHTLVSTGFDAYGGFPHVAPGSAYSVRLGNSQSGGQAERISQTFTVSSSTTSFTYQYAVVLWDPQHVAANQPFFEIKMTDQNNNLIPCSYYFVAAGQGIPGFMTSNVIPFVIYKPWSTAYVDLTAYIGQDVTIAFSVADCGEGGHFGYAFVDGSCLPFNVSQQDSLCTGNSITLSAPPGSTSYLWTPGGATSQNITVSAPGNYCVAMVSNTGCTTTVCQNVAQYPGPTANFSINSGGCTLGAAFLDASVITVDSIISWQWNFGDGNTSTLQNPTHVYATTGTYNVTLTVTAANGCTSTITQQFTTGSQSTFSNNTVCSGNATDFDFNIPGYSTWLWDFGDPASGGNNSSTQQNPSHVFSSSGSYNVTLIASTGTGCSDTIIQTVNVGSQPVASFSSATLATGGGASTVSFTNTSSGATSWFWSFGDSTTSVDEHPVHTYAAEGVFEVCLLVTGTNGCFDSICEFLGDLMIPNVFTPNGDNTNDFLVFQNLQYFPGSHLEIYDRWGVKVYISDDYQNDWNGKKMNTGGECVDGTYYYILSGPSLKETHHGFVTLIRGK